jgi:hypothetical protein
VTIDPVAYEQQYNKRVRQAPSASSAGATAAEPDVADELAKLATLRDRGILTDAEFAAQKAKLLAR